MPKTRLWQSVTAVLLLLALLCQGTMALAGTTGGLTGTVTDAQTRTPIAGARVQAISPSQQATVTTDANGRFSFLSLNPDTYTVSVDKQGYDPASLSGISVFADQTQTLQLQSRKSLQVIGRVTARANSDLVRSGTTADVYSVNATQQAAVAALGGGGSLNQAYSAVASVPGTYVPQGQSGWAQSVYVRGGNYTQVGYEFDGVPIQRSFDQYPGGTLSALGQQEVQVYTGAAPASGQSTGLAGYINQVIKSGTYPGFGSADLGIGAPTFYHKAEVEAGGASPNRNFSYYFGTAGYNQEYRYVDQSNGSSYDSQYGSLYNVVALNCGKPGQSAGCYNNALGTFGAIPLGPNGYAFGPFNFGIQSENIDRETVANFHFGLPHKRGDQGKDDVQLLFQNSFLRQVYPTSLSDWTYVQPYQTATGPLSGGALYNGQQYLNCANVAAGTNCALLAATQPQYYDSTLYSGPVGVPFTANLVNSVQPYYFPNSPQNRTTDGYVNPTQRDTYDIRTGILKLQYQRNINQQSFLRVYGYSFYSDWLQNGINSLNYNFVGGVSSDYELASHTRGASLSYVNQINQKHLLNFTTSYTYANTFRWNNSTANGSVQRPVALLLDSSNPTNGLCYGPNAAGALVAKYCGSSSAFAYRLPGFGTVGTKLSPNTITVGGNKYTAPTVGTENTLTCGGGPCQYYTVQSGLAGAYNTVQPAFTAASLEDTFRPSERWNINLGVRYDNFRYNLPSTSAPSGPEPQSQNSFGRTVFTNSYNLFNCRTANFTVVAATSPGVCPAGSVSVGYSTTSPSYNQYTSLAPRIGATYTAGPGDVYRFSFGRYLQPASSAFQQYNNARPNLLSGAPNTALLALGALNPARQVYPENSYNTDFSWEHQVRGSDVSWKVTPFYRVTKGEIVNVLLDPKTNYVSGINVGRKRALGAEFLVRKGDFDRNGFAGQLAYTYTYARIKFDTLPNGSTAIDPINQQIQAYNAYTSFCASNQSDPRCTTGTNSAGQAVSYTTAGAPASPCYIPQADGTTLGGSCATAGAIANPYWNAPVQNLFDPRGEYVAYNQLPGAGVASVSSSYVVPHVATLVLNYKHDKLSITPTFQLAAGGQYGSPVNGFGVDPTSCAVALSSGPTGDPRYPYGAPGGAAYDASQCTNGITAPNQFTHNFDNFGAFREPTAFTGNVQLGYQASKNVKATLTLVNVVNSCFGGDKQPWTIGGRLGCWYTSPFSGTNAGNFYNPGDVLQPAVAYPYGPSVGNMFQQAYGGQANPFQAFLSLQFRL